MTTPHVVIDVPPGIINERIYILIKSIDNGQEITTPAGWRLERNHYDMDMFWAVISRVRTDYLGMTVTISLLKDTKTFARILPDYEIKRWLT
jgi:hypothetical protein